MNHLQADRPVRYALVWFQTQPHFISNTTSGVAAPKRFELTTPAKPAALSQSVDALYKRPGFMLRRAHQISVSLFMEQAGSSGVTTTQYGVLVILRCYEGLDQIGLSKKVGLDRSTTGMVIKKLESDGLVVRIEDPNDRRRKIIVLTARGERMLEGLRPGAARAQEIALSAFSSEEADQFLHLLEKFVNKFNGMTRAPIIHDDEDERLAPSPKVA